MGNSMSKYSDTYSSFSGTDMVAIFEIPFAGEYLTKVIGTLQTLTYSIHNEKIPVRTLGDMNAKQFIFGGRIIAGTMIFTVMNRHWLREFVDEYRKVSQYSQERHWLSDELPPINITISMNNEYGQSSRLSLYGVTFVNEGQTMSINDIYTENTFEYFAKDIDYLGAVDIESGKNARIDNDDVKQVNTANAQNTIVDVDVPKGSQGEASSSSEYASDKEMLIGDLESKTGALLNPNLYLNTPKETFITRLESRAEMAEAVIEGNHKERKLTEEEYQQLKELRKNYYKQAIEKANAYYSSLEKENEGEDGQ